MATEFKFPDVGEGITEGEIVLWLVEEGEKVKQDQPLVQVETDKAVVEIPSPRAGVILKIMFHEGDIVKVGETLVVIGEEGEKFEEKKEYVGIVGQIEEKPAPKPAARPQVLAVPAVRKLAKELGVDIAMVKGTGEGGRVTEEDVRRFGEQAHVSAVEDSYGEVERVSIMRVRRSISQKMVRSKFSIPHVTHMDLANASALVRLRSRQAEEAQGQGIHLTYLPYIMKAAALSLKKHAYLNSSIDTDKNEILLKKYVNIGFAVETDDGLLVPVVKKVDEKNILQLAEETQKLADLCRDRKVALADLKGGTFSITNIGSLGGIYSTPIINHPEAANLAVGKIRKMPWVADGEITVIDGVYLSLSFDHRILDGAEAARFTNDVIHFIENPETIA
ncbi:MAG: 2-oxo acid dehydrogenase subunit E2 [Candidatus Abyssobacteria bacterium SURF_17]|jgi:pyruvate dehydrogenase E2 component (dihydrolipoamide acetyltransferase)|uniref:Dihydrolipoamide acetyltransferase component of pyruvate dehydrogenase complex n=1 Tax=Candidatus Abyssobacteria bacterium SURF_17 TaxID=2093361 RepID=A0A419F4K3_9BACT|nr:MAG: 2-oxo acid dehydrogenase subunit E2 [Candidatus Abyssubacteria bacterium SURF_17]